MTGGGCRRTLGSHTLRKIRGARLSRGGFQKSEITSRKVSLENRPGVFFGKRELRAARRDAVVSDDDDAGEEPRR
jgi:hypothetical protein